MNDNSDNQHKSGLLKVLIYCATQDELDLMKSTLPIIDGFWDGFTDMAKAKEAIASGEYGIIIADFTSKNPNGRDLLLAANALSTQIKSICVSWRTRIDVVSRMWNIDNGFYFTYKGEETDAMTVALYSMFTESTHIKWFNHMQGEFNAMREKVGREKTQTVLLNGSVGTGKFTLAQIAHIRSPRRNARFVFANCSSIIPHVVRKWTALEKSHFLRILRSMVEEAQGGTLYFHEINMLDTEALELIAGYFSDDLKVNTENSKFNGIIICSSSTDLVEMTAAHICPPQLLKILHKNVIRVPSLVDYSDNLELLAIDMLKNYCISQNIEPKVFSKSALRIITDHVWTRNLRELFDVIKHAVFITKGKRISDDAIVMKPIVSERDSKTDKFRKVKQALRDAEGKKRKAAKALEIAPKTLYAWMKEMGIPYDYK